MFPAEKKGQFEPYKVREKRVEVKAANGTAPKDVEMKDAEPAQQDNAEGKTKPEEAKTTDAADGAKETEGTEGGQGTEEPKAETTEEIIYEEDITSDEGAVYPLQNGRIVDWPCFFSLLTHIYNALSPPFHTPIMLISEPVWSARDREIITQFVFEKFKTPAFCMMDSALAVCYAYGTATATVVDVGHGKADVTAITDFLVNEHGRGVAVEGCGGEAMTDRLVELLGPKGFTREMCEQLKRSNITEILPPGTPLPGKATTAMQGGNPAAAASTGAQGGAPNTTIPRGPGSGTQTGTEGGEGGDGEDDEGVLNVAAIVSGNTSEYLARREREKAEKAASKKAAAGEGSKPVRLPNSKKEKASFQFQEYVRIEPEEPSGPGRYIRHKRDIEVGIERFLLASPPEKKSDRLSNGILEDIAAQIHHTILSVPDATKRSDLWDSLIVLGNGSKIKGEIMIFGLFGYHHHAKLETRFHPSSSGHDKPEVHTFSICHDIHF